LAALGKNSADAHALIHLHLTNFAEAGTTVPHYIPPHSYSFLITTPENAGRHQQG